MPFGNEKLDDANLLMYSLDSVANVMADKNHQEIGAHLKQEMTEEKTTEQEKEREKNDEVEIIQIEDKEQEQEQQNENLE